MLGCVVLPCVVLYHDAFHCTVLHCIIFFPIAWCGIVSFRMMLSGLNHIMSYHIKSCYVSYHTESSLFL